MPAKPLSIEQRADARRLRAMFQHAQDADPSLTQLRLAQICGWNSQGSVSQYILGKIPMNLEALMKFARALNVAPAAISPSLAKILLPGAGPNVRDSDRGNVSMGPDIKGVVPVISWVRAGAWSDVQDPHAAGYAEEWLPCPVPHGPRTFVLKVRGMSMENPFGKPSFSEGDLIFVDPDREALHRSLVIAKLELEQEATFKQLVVEGDRRYLKALNPAFPGGLIEAPPDCVIVGVVIFKGERI